MHLQSQSHATPPEWISSQKGELNHSDASASQGVLQQGSAVCQSEASPACSESMEDLKAREARQPLAQAAFRTVAFASEAGMGISGKGAAPRFVLKKSLLRYPRGLSGDTVRMFSLVCLALAVVGLMTFKVKQQNQMVSTEVIEQTAVVEGEDVVASKDSAALVVEESQRYIKRQELNQDWQPEGLSFSTQEYVFGGVRDAIFRVD